MTTQGFRNSGYREQWQTFLQTDCGKLILSLMERKPNSLPSIQGIHHTDAVVARMYAFDAGANSQANLLRELAEPWVDQSAAVNASNRPEWEDNLPPEIKEAVKKLRESTQQS